LVAKHSGTTGSQITFNVKSPKTWSPDSPNLYDVKVKMGQDTISSYTGFRTVTSEKVNGVQRILLVCFDTVLMSVPTGSVNSSEPQFKTQVVAHQYSFCEECRDNQRRGKKVKLDKY
jgi:hypothetical protein